jgi:molybdenum cofactor cytidylyltransferase
MAATLRAGVAAMPADAAGAFVLLGDMPLIPPEVLGLLARAIVSGAKAAAPVYDGRRGHPVLFGAAMFPALLALEGDQGARVVLKALGDAFAAIETNDPGVVFDVDTRAQLR